MEKAPIVVDTRFNGGGNLVDPLAVFLSGQVYYSSTPRGRQIGVEPGMRCASRGERRAGLDFARSPNRRAARLRRLPGATTGAG